MIIKRRREFFCKYLGHKLQTYWPRIPISFTPSYWAYLCLRCKKFYFIIEYYEIESKKYIKLKYNDPRLLTIEEFDKWMTTNE